MRTTVILPDELYRLVKQRVRLADQTMTSFLETALRHELARLEAAAARPADVFLAAPTGRGGLQAGVDLIDASALLDVLDDGLAIEKRR